MISKNLKYLLNRYAISPTALSKSTGVPQPTIHRILTGESKEPRTSNLRPISEYFNISIDDLSTRDLAGDKTDTDSNILLTPAATGARPLSIISFVQASKLAKASETRPSGSDVVYTSIDLSRSAFALEIFGDSMLPDFQPGDRIIVDPEVEPQPGDFVVANNNGEEALFRKYRPKNYDNNGNLVFELLPLNSDYPTLSSDVLSLEVIGVMMEHRKYRKKR